MYRARAQVLDANLYAGLGLQRAFFFDKRNVRGRSTGRRVLAPARRMTFLNMPHHSPRR